MSYSCCDFVDTILDALEITVPEESQESPSDQADLALAAIARLRATPPEPLKALQALLDWGREHTSPRDPHSPHALLVAAAEALARATPLSPPRVIMDLSGGLLEAAYCDAPVQILAFDEDDRDHPRAIVPTIADGAAIWAQQTAARLAPEFVAQVFAGISWLQEEAATGAAG